MPEQTAIATGQRRNLILEAIRRLSKTCSWVTQRDLLADLTKQGYDVQKHQILRDLKELMKIHVELECRDEADENGRPRRGIEYGYRWVARDAPPETGLSIPEALSLTLVSRYLKQALPVTLTTALNRLFERAESTLELQKRNDNARWQDLIGIIPPTQPLLPPKIDEGVTQVIHEALVSGERFRGAYRNVNGEAHERSFNPLGIMIREPSVYLIAWVEEHEGARMYAMHRFLSATREYLPARQPEGFSLRRFLEEQGNFGPGQFLDLEAKVNPHLGAILEETPLAENQVLGEADASGWRTLSARVRDNWQFRWWLLAQGSRMIVLAPEALRNSVREDLEKALENYSHKV